MADIKISSSKKSKEAVKNVLNKTTEDCKKEFWKMICDYYCGNDNILEELCNNRVCLVKNGIIEKLKQQVDFFESIGAKNETETNQDGNVMEITFFFSESPLYLKGESMYKFIEILSSGITNFEITTKIGKMGFYVDYGIPDAISVMDKDE